MYPTRPMCTESLNSHSPRVLQATGALDGKARRNGGSSAAWLAAAAASSTTSPRVLHGLVVATSMPPAWHLRRVLAKGIGPFGPAERVAAVLPLRTRHAATSKRRHERLVSPSNARRRCAQHAAHSTFQLALTQSDAVCWRSMAGARTMLIFRASSNGGRAGDRPSGLRQVGGRSRTSTPMPPASRCVDQKSPSCPCMSSTMYSTCVSPLFQRIGTR